MPRSLQVTRIEENGNPSALFGAVSYFVRDGAGRLWAKPAHKVFRIRDGKPEIYAPFFAMLYDSPRGDTSSRKGAGIVGAAAILPREGSASWTEPSKGVRAGSRARIASTAANEPGAKGE